MWCCWRHTNDSFHTYKWLIATAYIFELYEISSKSWLICWNEIHLDSCGYFFVGNCWNIKVYIFRIGDCVIWRKILNLDVSPTIVRCFSRRGVRELIGEEKFSIRIRLNLFWNAFPKYRIFFHFLKADRSINSKSVLAKSPFYFLRKITEGPKFRNVPVISIGIKDIYWLHSHQTSLSNWIRTNNTHTFEWFIAIRKLRLSDWLTTTPLLSIEWFDFLIVLPPFHLNENMLES